MLEWCALANKKWTQFDEQSWEKYEEIEVQIYE